MKQEERVIDWSSSFKEELSELGFFDEGFLWYANKDNTIKIRLWKNEEVDFWSWSGVYENQKLLFRGQIKSIDEVKWVLERCFDFKQQTI